MQGSPNERFDAKYIVEPVTGCWLWMGKKSGKSKTSKGGYALHYVNAKTVYGHRFSYERFKGEIPEGLDLDHKCRTRHCVNPDHLEPVTRKENVRRSGKVGSPKLTMEQAAHIRAEYATGKFTFQALGRAYGVCGTSIRNVVRHRTYKFH